MDRSPNEKARRALLPAGMADLLPPVAEQEGRVVDRLLGTFAAHGYERVKPPLVEFEDSLLDGPGQAMAPQTFRLMDPVSQRMLGVRADMTLQVARIAGTRLAQEPRPLRLSYVGEVLRVRGNELQPNRQFRQVGCELIGVRGAAADGEIVVLAHDALQTAGLSQISIDLTSATLVPALARDLALPSDEAARLRAALDRKDSAAVARVGGAAASLAAKLLHAAGPARQAIDAMAALDLPAGARAAAQEMADVVEYVRDAAPGAALTLDPVEMRGLEYHTGVCFSLFVGPQPVEAGRGGRYLAGGSEPATGLTLYMDGLIERASPDAPRRRVLLPLGTPSRDSRRLRGEGWVTVGALAKVSDAPAEARRLRCDHVYLAGEIRPVE
jgi:ATP phosphoribosyltransferase regulatory subunit